MRERGEVGITESGDCLAHQRVGSGALAVAQLLEHRDQIVDALLRDPRDLVHAGQCRLVAGAAAPRGCELASARSLEDAVRRAAAAASPGDTVLLAPACASFDMFRNYAHRGEVFRRAVEAL